MSGDIEDSAKYAAEVLKYGNGSQKAAGDVLVTAMLKQVGFWKKDNLAGAIVAQLSTEADLNLLSWRVADQLKRAMESFTYETAADKKAIARLKNRLVSIEPR